MPGYPKKGDGIASTPQQLRISALLDKVIKEGNDSVDANATKRQTARKENMYATTQLGNHLFGFTSGGSRRNHCTKANIDIYTNKMKVRNFRPTPPSDRTFSSDFSKAVKSKLKWERASEASLAPEKNKPIDQQCNYSIGKPIRTKTADMDNVGVMGSIGLKRTQANFKAVSYTHLTLPTILLV